MQHTWASQICTGSPPPQYVWRYMTRKCGIISIPWGLSAGDNGALWAMIRTGQSCKRLCHVNTERWALSRQLHSCIMLTALWLRVDSLYSTYAVGRVGQKMSKTVQLGNLRCGRFVWRQFYYRCRGSCNDTGCKGYTAEPARKNVHTCTRAR